jgi:hypothetical protein
VKRKIRFFCDTNNNFIYLSRMLTRLGFDSQVVSNFSTEGISYRVFDTIRKPSDWECIFEDKSFESQFLYSNWYSCKTKTKAIVEKVLGSDCISIGSNCAPAIFEFIGKKLDVFFPTGSDTLHMPFYKKKRDIERDYKFTFRSVVGAEYHAFGVRGIVNGIRKFYSLPKLQRSGIEKSHIALQDSQYLENWVDDRCALKITKLAIPMFDPEDCSQINSGSIISKIIRKERELCDFLAVSTQKNIEEKGTDHFVEGFLRFKKKFKGRAKLILSSRGGLWWVSRNCKEHFFECIANKDIVVIPALPSNELSNIYYYADCALGIISNFNWYLSSTISEILALGVPMISKIERNYLPHIENVYPYLHAENAEDVCNAMLSLALDSAKKKQMAEDSKNWFTSFCNIQGKKWMDFLDSLPC